MIELDDKVLGIWRAQLADDQDFLGALRDEGDTQKFIYRFRYYKDDRNDALSEDEKRWYTVTFTAHGAHTKEELINAIREIVAKLCELADTTVDEYIVGADGVKGAQEWLLRQPWCHASAPVGNA